MKKSPLWLAILSALTVQTAFTLLATSASAAVANPEKMTGIHTQELLNKSDLVFSGKVVDVQYKDSIDGIPHTFVTYAIDQVISGRPDADQITLRFMGGRQQRGEVIRYLEVSESPEFQVGDSDILFASKNNSSICPLANCTSGRFRNRDGVMTSDDGRAIIETQDHSYAFSSVVIDEKSEHKLDVSHGANAPAVATREPVGETLPANVISAESFIAELQQQAKDLASVRTDLPVFVSASIKDDFKSAAMTPVAAPADEAPGLLRRTTAPADFDRWEEEAVRNNKGNPVL